MQETQNHSKKKTFTYEEKDWVNVLFYLMALILYLSFVQSQNFVFVDESGLNRYYRRLYARAKRGTKIHDKRPGKREKRTNIIAGLLYGENEKKHIAVRCYEQSTTARLFEDWFEFELIPLLPENALVILDNASFHRKTYFGESPKGECFRPRVNGDTKAAKVT